MKATFPAALNLLFYTVRRSTDYQGDGTWEMLKRYVDSASRVSGREFCLWVIKDRRRTGGTLSPEIAKALDSHKGDPGVSRWADLLEKATLADLVAVEEDIRRK